MMNSAGGTRRLGRVTVAAALALAACGSDNVYAPVADDGQVLDETSGGSDPGDETASTSAAIEPPAGRSATDDPTTGKPTVQLPAEVPVELVVTDLIDGTGDAAEIGDTIERIMAGRTGEPS